MVVAAATYPVFKKQVKDLVEQHRKLKKPLLRLAVYYQPPRGPKHDIHLFEVIDGFAGNEIDREGKLFKFGYGSTPAFPLPPESTLRMVLTNPAELNEAIQNDWKDLDALRKARSAGKATLIFRRCQRQTTLGFDKMTLPQAWMQQAESDLRTFQQVDQVDPRTRCQAISKYQQSVEKSVKAILDRLHAAALNRKRF